MTERFEDFVMFMIGVAVLTTFAVFVIFVWVAMTSPNLPFCARWAPVLDLPPALELRHPKHPAEIPVFFCGRLPSQCRVA